MNIKKRVHFLSLDFNYTNKKHFANIYRREAYTKLIALSIDYHISVCSSLRSVNQEKNLIMCASKIMVERTGIEPVTPTMSTWCSPAELTLQTLHSNNLLTIPLAPVKNSLAIHSFSS